MGLTVYLSINFKFKAMKKLIFIFIAIVSISSCSSDDDETTTNIQLYDKPLPVIKSHIEGKWELHYTDGGIAGIVHYYENSFWIFDFSSVQDSIKQIYDGNVTIDTNLTWVLNQGTSIDGDSFYIMSVSDGRNLVIKGIYNDTLVIHTYAADGLFFHFTKSNPQT